MQLSFEFFNIRNFCKPSNLRHNFLYWCTETSIKSIDQFCWWNYHKM